MKQITHKYASVHPSSFQSLEELELSSIMMREKGIDRQLVPYYLTENGLPPQAMFIRKSDQVHMVASQFQTCLALIVFFRL